MIPDFVCPVFGSPLYYITYCFQASGGICKFVLMCKNIFWIGPSWSTALRGSVKMDLVYDIMYSLPELTFSVFKNVSLNEKSG